MTRLRDLLRKRASGGAALGYNKLCELDDFANDALAPYFEAIFPPDAGGYAPGREHRKFWEIAQAARTLVDFGAAHESAEILGVGAGTEPTMFWATNLVRRVFATDLYLDPGGWEKEAPRSMLVTPGEYATFPWNKRRLVVQHMDARDLRYEDESFDGIFCSSSIEHFGTEEDVRQALGEMWRVLKPGGIVSLSTEYRLHGTAPGVPGTLMFDSVELEDVIVRPFAWALVEPPDLSLSRRTAAAATSLSAAHASSSPHYPHVVLREGGLVFTSIHLALRKDGGAS